MQKHAPPQLGANLHVQPEVKGKLRYRKTNDTFEIYDKNPKLNDKNSLSLRTSFQMRIRLITVVILSQILLSCGMIRGKMTVNTFNGVDIKKDKVYYSPIIWSLDTTDNGKVRKNAFYLPVNIPEIGQKLKMQFDLGATSSAFYLKTINALGVNSPEILKSVSVNKDRYSYANTSIKLNDGIQLNADRIPIFRNMGHDTLPSTLPVFGTLGYDIIGDNILILDFINDSIAIVDRLPPEMESIATFIKDADLKKFPVILPFSIGKKKVRLLYDTGSSSFQVLTGTRRLKKASLKREIDVADSVNSWGQKVYLYRAKVPRNKENLFIGTYDLGEVDIIGTDNLNPLSLVGRYLYGIAGNIVFENTIIIIDRKNNRFGMIKQQGIKASPFHGQSR